MIEKKSLTKRERVLLIGAACGGMLVIMIQFVILPLNAQMGEKKEEYERLDSERTQLQLTLATESVIRDSHELALEKYEESRSLYLSESISSEVGRMLTLLVEAHDLTPINQALAVPRPFINDEIDAASSAISVISASMSVGGSYDNLKRLLNSVENIPFIRISQVSYSIFSVSDDSATIDRISLNFEVAMLEDVVKKDVE